MTRLPTYHFYKFLMKNMIPTNSGLNKNLAARMDLKSNINQSVCNDQTEIKVKSLLKSTKSLRISKSVHKILELVTLGRNPMQFNT